MSINKAELTGLQGQVNDLLAEVYIPEKACSCHISPPCGDCVEYSVLREARDTLAATFAQLFKKLDEPEADCTCPSGDGSLRHPCPAHPKPEQAVPK